MNRATLQTGFAAMVSILFVCGCDPSGTGEPSSDPFKGTPEEFVAQLAELHCQKYLQCDFGFTSGDELGFRGIASLQDCVDRNESAYLYPPTARNLAAGRLVFDRVAAGRCIGSFSSLCTAGVLYSECGGLFDGAVELGQPCEDDSICASGACSGSSSTCGMCEPALSIGDACTVGSGLPCPYGSTCRSTAAGGNRCSTAENTTPVYQVGHGAACTFDATGSEVRYCGPGEYCGEGATCQSRLPVGAECFPSLDPCVFDAVCVDDGTGTTRCLAIVSTSTEGASCRRVGSEFIACDYAAGLACAADSTCVVIAGDGSLGSACTDDAQCGSLLCDAVPSPGACVAGGLADGEPCGINAQCLSARCDRPDGINWVCVPGICP